MPMDRNQVREWKAGYDYVNKLQLEEAKNRTMIENLRLATVLKRNFENWPFGQAQKGDLEFFEIWEQARKAWLAKHG